LLKVKKDNKLLRDIVLKNINIKISIVKKDEFELGDRKLLNFGHTLGHALETQYELTHGQAVSLGMVFAAWMSEKHLGFKDGKRLESTLLNYGLPVRALFDVNKVFRILKMDKKRINTKMNYILLKKTGMGCIHQFDVDSLQNEMTAFNKLNKS
jgi:3-dehydroquinate synthase